MRRICTLPLLLCDPNVLSLVDDVPVSTSIPPKLGNLQRFCRERVYTNQIVVCSLDRDANAFPFAASCPFVALDSMSVTRSVASPQLPLSKIPEKPRGVFASVCWEVGDRAKLT